MLVKLLVLSSGVVKCCWYCVVGVADVADVVDVVAWLLGCLVVMEVCRKVDVDIEVETEADVDVDVETETSNTSPLLLVLPSPRGHAHSPCHSAPLVTVLPLSQCSP